MMLRREREGRQLAATDFDRACSAELIGEMHAAALPT